MVKRLFVLLIASSLSACNFVKVNVDEADVGTEITRVKFKTLNTSVRKVLNAVNPDALITVIDDGGVTVYGATDKNFRVLSEDQLKKELSKIDGKKPVNNLVIKTFVNSPGCHLFLNDIGGAFWYPGGCPH